MLNAIKVNPDLDKIEVSFKLSAHINRHNFVYCYSEKMYLTLEQKINQLFGARYQISLFSKQFFFYGRVTGDKYLQILTHQIVPQ